MRSAFLKISLIVLLFLARPIAASAHEVDISFTRSVSDTGAVGSGYTVWRLSGTCPSSVTDTSQFTPLNSNFLTVTTYSDLTVVPGSYCYVVTFTNASGTSVPSPTASATVLPAAPVLHIGPIN